jgi:hypothetical protein
MGSTGPTGATGHTGATGPAGQGIYAVKETVNVASASLTTSDFSGTDTLILHNITMTTTTSPTSRIIALQYSLDGTTFMTAAIYNGVFIPIAFWGLNSGYVITSRGGAFGSGVRVKKLRIIGAPSTATTITAGSMKVLTPGGV